MRTRATKTPSVSRTSTASGCRPASDPMVARAHPSVAVDGIVLQSGKLVAVRRKNEPYGGIRRTRRDDGRGSRPRGPRGDGPGDAGEAPRRGLLGSETGPARPRHLDR